MEPVEPRKDKWNRHNRAVVDPGSVLPGSSRWKVDPEHLLDVVGIVGTVLNLLVVVLVYIYTPV